MTEDKILLGNDGSLGVLIGKDLHEFKLTTAELRHLAGQMLAIAAMRERAASDPFAGAPAGNA